MTDIRALLKRLNRANRSEDSERGFSLIELIIVIVILGILVAIAIPVYNNIQDTAKQNAANAAAANIASEISAKAAQNGTAPTLDDASTGSKKDVTGLTLTAPGGATVSLSNFCVTLTKDSHEGKSGPGC